MHLNLIHLLFQFVLKHERFLSIREVADYPMTLCPLNEGESVPGSVPGSVPFKHTLLLYYLIRNFVMLHT